MKGKGFCAKYSNKKQEIAFNNLLKKSKTPLSIFKSLMVITKQKKPCYKKILSIVK